MTGAKSHDPWPALPLNAWKDTYDTLHLCTQIVGKVRLELTPPVNHFWHVPLYVTSRGLNTSPIPYRDHAFSVYFDFIDHKLVIVTSDGGVAMIPLVPRSVADFYHSFMSALKRLEIDVHINPMPQEVPNPIPFDQDNIQRSYDPEYVQRCWRILLSADTVMREFRGRFVGKCSPVHLFWGSFDLAVTRFSGRRAPVRPDADHITRESYSHECSSAGWWPGGVAANGAYLDGPAFYSYAVPQPPGFAESKVRPEAAHYDDRLGEFVLLYDDVRQAASPRHALMEFLQSTYEAAADCGKWDRAALEEPPSWPRGESYAA
jgi:hypothetical protein